MIELARQNDFLSTLPQGTFDGLERIVLAVNAADTNRYLAGFLKIHEPLIAGVHALKLPREATVEHASLQRTVDIKFEQLAATLARKKKIPRICIDTKFSNDGKDLAASVRGLRVESSNFVHNLRQKRQMDERHRTRIEDMQKERRAITFLMHHMVDPLELEEAVTAAREWYDPIAIVSSSKQNKGTNARYGFSHPDLTASVALLAMDAGITHLTAAANDAEFIRDVLSDHSLYEELIISGTGAVIDQSDVGEHDAPSSVLKTSHAVDYFVLGQAILFHEDPETRLIEYAGAIGTKNI